MKLLLITAIVILLSSCAEDPKFIFATCGLPDGSTGSYNTQTGQCTPL